MLPFTREQFVAVVAGYNEAIWPLQVAGYIAGIVALAVLFRRSRHSNRIIAGVLGAMWLWTGIFYHALFFATINRAAYLFGGLFVVEGISLAYAGLVRDQLRFGFRSEPAAWVGIALIVYAAVLYPIVGLATGMGYAEMPTFGVTPCPVTIFTFGMLLLTRKHVGRWLLAIPFIWSLIGGSASFLLDVPQDWVLLASGLIAVTLIMLRDHGRHGRHLTAAA